MDQPLVPHWTVGPVSLRRLAAAGSCDAEVLRMPAGSNPSWLSRRQFDAVLSLLPEGVLGRWQA